MKNKGWCFLVLALYLSSAPAYAYIDPSAGSLWIQSLIAIFATLGTVIRAYWQQIKSKLISIKKPGLKKNTTTAHTPQRCCDDVTESHEPFESKKQATDDNP